MAERAGGALSAILAEAAGADGPAAPLPWQQAAWQRLLAARRGERVAHAYLLRGPAGTGKLAFAVALARVLLCLAPGAEGPCGSCRSCILARGGAHPDFLHLGIEEGRREIRVDAVRAGLERATLTRRLAAFKPVLVEPADALNQSAASALLKTLEEPPPGTVFLLVTARSAAVLPTVRSRCQMVDLPAPARAAARAWLLDAVPGDAQQADELLDATDGRPRLALELAGEPRALEQRRRLRGELSALMAGRASVVDTARTWSEVEPQRLLDWMLAMGEGLARRCLCDAAVEPQLAALDVHRLYAILDQVVEARRLLAARANLNTTLLLEALALAWAGGARRTDTGPAEGS